MSDAAFWMFLIVGLALWTAVLVYEWRTQRRG